MYNTIFESKSDVESRYGSALIWEKLPNNKMSRIKTELKDVNLYEKEDWIKMSNFLVVNLPKFEKAIQSVINNTKI